MKTIKWLKISAVLQAVFAFFCFSSIACFALNRYLDIPALFSIGNLLVFGWILNPIGWVTLILGLVFYLLERRIPENRQRLGHKWIWFVVGFVVTTMLYLTTAVLTVTLTGGV